jgi:peptidoglycan/xylan/chitin deacetylase (PgdA/CDA1 family)
VVVGDQRRPSSEPTPTPKPAPEPVDCRKAKCVALTFDDGPMGSTSRLLDILARHKVKATFFLVGRNVETYPQLVRREAAEGHELANHSYSHADLGRSSSAKVASELERTQHAIRRASGVTPVLMRPPYGSTDKQVASVTRRLKLAQVLWTVDPLDWQNRDSERVERKVVGGARNGHIVLMHDIHPTTVDAVPLIIKRLAAKGYVFVTVSELYGAPLTPGKKYIERAPEPPERGPEPDPEPSESGA